MSSNVESEENLLLSGRRITFVGKLGGFSRREARQLVRQYGGTVADRVDDEVDLVVIGDDQILLDDSEEAIGSSIQQLAAEGKVEVLAETQLWHRLGLLDSEQNIRQLYTPAMLAQLLGVSVATIRRWHRHRLILPARQVHKLPYFDFQEIATARRLAQLMAAGASPQAIAKKLAQLAEFVPTVERPLAQLSVLVEGKELLLRQGEGLIDTSGQMRFDFDSFEEQPDAQPLKFSDHLVTARTKTWADDLDREANLSPEEWTDWAASLEDEGRLEEAIEVYRSLLAAYGPSADVCFLLAELLYRTGDLGGARERYYTAIELDEDYVEARANLGCVLAEEKQYELAVAAFGGALKCHPEYPDAHFHLARTLDMLGRGQQAEPHWREFLSLAPHSPWADEASNRLNHEMSTHDPTATQTTDI